jgi:hypothetical protein
MKPYIVIASVAGVTVSIPGSSIIGDIVQEQTPYTYVVVNSQTSSQGYQIGDAAIVYTLEADATEDGATCDWATEI